MRRGRGIRGGRPQRKVIEITSRSIPIRAEPSSTSIVLCAQSQGRISLVLEEKDNYGTKWFRIGAGWMCSKDANGFQCYQFTNEVIAQKYWAKEFDNRRRLSAAVGNLLVRTHALFNARRTARQIRENAVIYRDKQKPLLNLPDVSMENLLIGLQAAQRLTGPEIFEFIRIAAAHQSDPHKAIVDICVDTESYLLKRPSQWVKEDLGVINTVDARSKNDVFIMSCARNDLNTVEECMAKGQELAALHSDLQYTALHAAADFGSTRIVELLIRSGMGLNLRDAKHGMTALHYAAQSGREEVCQALLDSGADRTMVTYEGKQAFEIARYQGHKYCADLLKHVPPEITQVELITRSTTSISIEWEIPRIDLSYMAPVTYYSVMHEPTDSKRCGYGNQYRCEENKFSIDNLPPATGHSFKIISHSISGMSPASAKVIHFTLPDVPVAPNPIELLKISKNGLFLSWHPPKYDNGSKVSMYQVQIRSAMKNLDLDENGDLLDIITSLGIEEPDDNVTVDEDDEDDVLSSSQGPAVNNEAVDDIDKRYRLLNWNKLNKRSTFVIGLQQDMPYRARVRARNDSGFSNWSDWTGDMVPEDGVYVEEFGEGFATLRWFSPRLVNRRVDGFELQMTVPKGPLETSIKVYDHKEKGDAKEIITVTTEDESEASARTGASYDFRTIPGAELLKENRFTVHGLGPGCRYQFRVRAKVDGAMTKWGMGYSSSIITTPSAPPDPVTDVKICTLMKGSGVNEDGESLERPEVDHNSIGIEWIAGNPNGSSVEEIQVLAARIRDYRPEDLESASIASSPQKSNTINDSLNMSTLGLESLDINNTNPKIVENNNSSIPIPLPSLQTSGVSGSSTATELTWTNVTTSGIQRGPQSFKVMNLLSGSSYIFRVRVRNECGWSNYSIATEMTTTTLVGPPLAPFPKLVKTHYMILQWKPAKDNQFNFSAMEFQLEGAVLPVSSKPTADVLKHLVWKRCEVREHREDEDNNTSNEQRTMEGGYLLVDKLKPSTPYIFRMRMRSVVGWSSWSMPSEIIPTLGTS